MSKNIIKKLNKKENYIACAPFLRITFYIFVQQLLENFYT